MLFTIIFAGEMRGLLESSQPKLVIAVPSNVATVRKAASNISSIKVSHHSQLLINLQIKHFTDFAFLIL